MSNPVMELAELFESWNTDQLPKKSRGHDSDEALSAAEHVRAMVLLADTKRMLEHLSDRSMIAKNCLRYVPSMANAIISIEASWTDHYADSNNFHPVMMEALLNAAYDVQRIIDENDRNQPAVESMLGEVRNILVSDDSLDADLKSYISELLNSIRINLERNGLGREFDFEKAMKELWVALLAAQNATKEEKSRWAQAATRVRQVMTGAAKHGAPWAALAFTVYTHLALGPGQTPQAP